MMSSRLPLYLLDLLVSGHSPLYIALLLEPGADGLEGAISTAPTIVIHTVLHVVAVAVDPLNQVHLEKTHIYTLNERQIEVIIREDTSKSVFKLIVVPFHDPERDV